MTMTIWSRTARVILASVFCCLSYGATLAHPVGGSAQYIANEGVMVEHGTTKILFDPIFNNGFGAFPLVAADVRAQLMAGEAPFDGVDVVFISHAHGDHFAAQDMIAYMLANPHVRLIAPPQALARMSATEDWDAGLLTRIMARPLDLNMSMDHIFDVGDDDDRLPISVTRLRVPHIGGEMHEAVENMIYRVTLGPGATVMHLGDADADPLIFENQSELFSAVRTDMAFMPFWLIESPGELEMRALLNAAHTVGIHVAIDVPDDLAASGADYFSIPGESRDLQNPNSRKEQPHE